MTDLIHRMTAARVVAAATFAVFAAGLSALTTQPVETQPAEEAPENTPPITSKAWGTRLEPEPPGYVKTPDQSGLDAFKDVDWLDFGLVHRTRFELRRNDYRRNRSQDLPDEDQFLLRTQAYVGIRKILDPFRFGLEVADMRQFNSDFPESTDDANEADFVQAFAELYFTDALGPGQPLQFRVGRFTMDLIDRRLIGRNRWRNTISAFDGFRLRLGQPSSDWQVDVFAVMPVERRSYHLDRSDEERWFYGIIGAWRGWSPHVVLEPYYLVLDEDFKDRDARDREVHTLGMHGFGLIGKTGFDYDFNTAFQFGDDGERDICAYAMMGELGYSFKHPWKPRLSFSTAYASGDRDPEDNQTNRFDRLFEVGHSWADSDLFDWRNTIAPKIRLELRPVDPLRLTLSYGAYWLASDSDAWPRVGRRDEDGESGDFVGQEIDLQLRYQVSKRMEIELGYSHFMPGTFVENTGPADDSDFFYVQATLSLF